MDTVIESMHQHFLNNGTLYADFSLLDPKNFSQVTSYARGFPETALQELTFDGRATAQIVMSSTYSRTVEYVGDIFI